MKITHLLISFVFVAIFSLNTKSQINLDKDFTGMAYFAYLDDDLYYQPDFNNTTFSLSQKTENSRSRYIIPRVAYSCASGDIDQDGDNDIVIGHNHCFATSWSGVSIMLNDGFGYFELYDSIYFYSGQPNIRLADIDKESYLDIIALDKDQENGERFIAIINDFITGDISYYNLNSDEIVGLYTTGDVNGDDNTDVIVASNAGQCWGVMYNNGFGQLSQPSYRIVSGYYPSAVACGDLNENGRDDVVVCGQSTEVFFSNPEGFESLLLEDSDFKEAAFIIDLDLDGDNDLLTFDGIPIVNISVLKMYENQGGGILDTLETFYFHGLSSEVFISDFNNDSLADALFTLTDKSGLVLLFNIGGFQFGDSIFIPLESYGQYEGRWYCSSADYDGNGFNDIAITRQAQIQLPDNLVVLFNDGNGNFGEDPLTTINNASLPGKNLIQNCFPNPFTTETTFQLSLNQTDGNVRIRICDLMGSLIRTLAVKDHNIPKPYTTIKWDGKDNSGNICKPGVYIVSFEINGIVTKQIKIIIHN